MKTAAFFVLIMILSDGCRSSVSSVNRDFSAKELPAERSSPNRVDRYDVEFCDLLKNAKSFDGKKVNIAAILITGREYTYLYDPNCVSDDQLVWYRFESIDVNRKFDLIINPENEEYRLIGLVRAQATFSGVFHVKKDTGFGNEGFFNYKLDITDAENITVVPSNVPYPWPTPATSANPSQSGLPPG